MHRSDDRTPLVELKRNFLAALAVLGVVGIGAVAFVTLLDWLD